MSRLIPTKEGRELSSGNAVLEILAGLDPSRWASFQAESAHTKSSSLSSMALSSHHAAAFQLAPRSSASALSAASLARIARTTAPTRSRTSSAPRSTSSVRPSASIARVVRSCGRVHITQRSTATSSATDHRFLSTIRASPVLAHHYARRPLHETCSCSYNASERCAAAAPVRLAFKVRCESSSEAKCLVRCSEASLTSRRGAKL
mmetsp:Transcript_12404/g.33469  ORF Transcript_12404/g.33469 Transcript_12404/m.33469 type:complete len:205 (+) Transcript_12404:573-1187(+)